MTEHAHDAMPHEEQEPEALVAPNATVTIKQLRAAIDAGRWTHEEPTTALWLNTSFPPAGREASELVVDLTAHGIACS